MAVSLLLEALQEMEDMQEADSIIDELAAYMSDPICDGEPTSPGPVEGDAFEAMLMKADVELIDGEPLDEQPPLTQQEASALLDQRLSAAELPAEAVDEQEAVVAAVYKVGNITVADRTFPSHEAANAFSNEILSALAELAEGRCVGELASSSAGGTIQTKCLADALAALTEGLHNSPPVILVDDSQPVGATPNELDGLMNALLDSPSMLQCAEELKARRIAQVPAAEVEEVSEEPEEGDEEGDEEEQAEEETPEHDPVIHVDKRQKTGRATSSAAKKVQAKPEEPKAKAKAKSKTATAKPKAAPQAKAEVKSKAKAKSKATKNKDVAQNKDVAVPSVTEVPKAGTKAAGKAQPKGKAKAKSKTASGKRKAAPKAAPAVPAPVENLETYVMMIYKKAGSVAIRAKGGRQVLSVLMQKYCGVCVCDFCIPNEHYETPFNIISLSQMLNA